MLKRFTHYLILVLFSALTSSAILLAPTPSLAAQVTLAWDHNNPAPAGYRIYQRTGGQAYDYSRPCWTGTANKSIIDNLKDATTYYFVVRAYASSQESANSNEVEFIYRTPASSSQTDSDGDGIVDTDDAFPLDLNEWIDSDLDGVGDNADTDDDDDGMPDKWEAQYGLDPKVDDTLNTDADGISNIDKYKNSSDPSTADVDNAVSDVSNIVIDDGQSGTSSSGQWMKSGGANPYGSTSLYAKGVGPAYSYQSSISGAYDVEVRWTEYSNRCTAIPVKVYDGSTLLETVVVNQKQDGGLWNYFGMYEFTGQAKVIVFSANSVCTTSADAVKFSKRDN